MLYEIQVFGHMRLGHQRAVFTARQAVSNPWRILVTGDTDPMIERTTAEPAEKNVFVRELAAVLKLFLSQDQIKHRNHARRTAPTPKSSTRSLPAR